MPSEKPAAVHDLDEVLFGYEVIEDMPRIMAELVALVIEKGAVKADLKEARLF